MSNEFDLLLDIWHDLVHFLPLFYSAASSYPEYLTFFQFYTYYWVNYRKALCCLCSFHIPTVFPKKIYTFSFPKFKLEFKLMASTWPLIFFMEIPILPCLLMVSLKMLPWLFSHYSIVIFSHFCDWWWIDKVETWALDLTPLACKSIIELWAHLLHCHFFSILILTLSCLSPKKFQSNQF